MKRPTFMEGAIVAAAASVGGAVLFGALTTVFAMGPVLRLLITVIGLAYVIYLLRRSEERVGRISVLTVWTASAAMIWWLSPSLPVYLCLHVGMIWVIRSLYFHSGILSSAADLGISALALAAGVSGGLYTSSIFLGVWCFFLTQALFVAIPAVSGWRGPERTGTHVPNDRFDRAHRAAESALCKFPS